jgi:hypothetical protein
VFIIHESTCVALYSRVNRQELLLGENNTIVLDGFYQRDLLCLPEEFDVWFGHVEMDDILKHFPAAVPTRVWVRRRLTVYKREE